MKNRLQRVNELMKRELGELVQREITFTAKLVTIQQVDVTPNLKQAYVYVGVIGNEVEQRAAMAQLHDKRVMLQGQLSKRVILKYTPQLHFKLDETIERGSRILNILGDLNLPEPDPEAEAAAEPAEAGETVDPDSSGR